MDALTLTASDHSQRQPDDVYKRLHDVRSYTGVYRKRFELKIHDLTDTVVHDFAGTVRPYLNHDVENRPRRPTLCVARLGLSQTASHGRTEATYRSCLPLPNRTPRRSLTLLNAAAAVANETLASVRGCVVGWCYVKASLLMFHHCRLMVQQPSPERSAPCPSPVRLEGDPNDPHTLLRAVFHYYCRFGRTGSKGANETTMGGTV
jgi:hypothetical protein